MSTFVADASPFTHLAAIGRAGLLREIYGTVLVPARIWQEMAEAGQGRPGEVELRQAVAGGWVVVESVAGPVPSVNLSLLHPGEIEALQLAIAKKADLVILDEKSGRQAATSLGFRVVGVVGILVEARRRNLVSDLSAELTRLRTQGGFRLSQAVIEMALRFVGELK